MATPLLFNYNYNTSFPLNWRVLYFERIDYALSFQGDQNLKIAPLIEASRMSFLLKKPLLSLKYLAELQKILPDYAWIYYFHGRIFLEEGNHEQALLSLEKAADCALTSPELLRQFVLPVIENGNTCDYRRITDYMWQSVRHHNNEFQTNALLHLVFELTGAVYQRIGKPEQATDSYLKAIDYIAIPDCIYRLNPLFIQSGNFEMLLHCTEKGIENSPYDTILILYKAYALIQLKQRKNAAKVLKDHRRALISFVNVRKIVIIRYLISLLLVLVFFGRQPGSKFIIEFIRVLRNKLGFIYLA
jgi:tetratricopeptide (TPR) repeat protein